MLALCAIPCWVVLLGVVRSVSICSPLSFDFERLAWLICSIVQCMAQHDGSCLATLTTTSPMAPRIRVLNGFRSMCRVRGIQSPRTPWDQPRMTQPPIGNGAKFTTSKCIGRGIAQAAPIQVLFRSRSLMHPSILGTIETGSPGDTNGWVVHTLALRGQFSLPAHRTSCTLD